MDVRYVGQNYELAVPWAGDLAALRRDFEALHQRLYGYATGDAMECVNLRVRAFVPADAARLPDWPGRRPGGALGRAARVLPRAGRDRLPIYRREDLAPEQPVQGPRAPGGPLGHHARLPGTIAPCSTGSATC